MTPANGFAGYAIPFGMRKGGVVVLLLLLAAPAPGGGMVVLEAMAVAGGGVSGGRNIGGMPGGRMSGGGVSGPGGGVIGVAASRSTTSDLLGLGGARHGAGAVEALGARCSTPKGPTTQPGGITGL